MLMLGHLLLRNEITGFEELAGIPGTIGGAIRMNAGAHGKEIKDIVKSVKCMDYEGNIKEFQNDEMRFEYRRSMLKEEKYIVLEAIFELQKGIESEIKKLKWMNMLISEKKDNLLNMQVQEAHLREEKIL